MYETEHADALRDLQADGAAVSFKHEALGNYDELTDFSGAPILSQVDGYAIQTSPNFRRYERLGLVVTENLTLFFVPTTFGQTPDPDALTTWAGKKYKVKDIDPFQPAGKAIFARVIIGL